jgi:large subunit ribosomal protein L10
MPRPDKVAITESTKASAEKAKSIVFADFTGMNVENVTELRRKLRENNVEYKVVKNRLAKISFQELGYDELIEHLTGPTAIAFGYDDPGASIRTILEVNKKTDIPKIKVILFEGKIFTADEAQKIVNLPSRDELIAKFIGGLNAPITNLVGNLHGILQKFVGTLRAIQTEKEKE